MNGDGGETTEITSYLSFSFDRLSLSLSAALLLRLRVSLSHPLAMSVSARYL